GTGEQRPEGSGAVVRRIGRRRAVRERRRCLLARPGDQGRDHRSDRNRAAARRLDSPVGPEVAERGVVGVLARARLRERANYSHGAVRHRARAAVAGVAAVRQGSAGAPPRSLGGLGSVSPALARSAALRADVVMLPFVCGAALVVATLWPSRFIGWLDGAPLDQRLEAIVVAILLPSLWYLDPAFLRTRAARLLTVALLAWKIGAWALVMQNGWCALLASKYAPPGDAYRIEQSWDARTLWTAAPPSCTAIVARPYATLEDFPAWTINVPYRSDYDLDQHADSLPLENPRPPDASYAMFVHGWISADRAGTLTLDVGRDTAIQGTVDGEPLAGARGAAAQVQLAAGSHAVDLRLDLHGTGWRFVPLWNGADLFRAVRT